MYLVQEKIISSKSRFVGAWLCYFRVDPNGSLRRFLAMRTGPSESFASGSCGFGFAELQELSDEQLMVHVKGRHDDALAVLFDRYHRLVLSIGLKILRDHILLSSVIRSKAHLTTQQ
jgi:hypothetical protein